MTNYPIHPACALWPRPSDEEVKAIAEGMKTEGLLNPIWLFEGKILDGKIRYEACRIAGVEPRFETYTGDNPIEFTIAQNKSRRHQTKLELAFVVAELAKLPQGGDRRSVNFKLLKNSLKGDRVTELATVAGIGTCNVYAAKAILKDGEPNVIDMVLSNKVGVQTAGYFVRNTPREQQRNATVDEVKQARHREKEAPRRAKTDVPVWGKHNRPVIIPSKKTIAERKKPQLMLTIPLRDVTERLRPIIKTLKQQSKCHMATVSFTTLVVLASQLEHLVEEWTSDGTELERTPNSVNPIALNERKAL